MIIQGYLSLVLHKNICCGYSLDGYSLESPRRGKSNEYLQHMFLQRNKQFLNYHQTPFLSLPLIVPTSRRSPVSVAAAAIYMASQASEDKKTQKGNYYTCIAKSV